MKTKYKMDIDLDGYELNDHFGSPAYLGAASVSTEGDNLLDLLDNAIIWTADQDGGEGPEISLSEAPNDLYCQVARLIRKEQKEQEGTKGKGAGMRQVEYYYDENTMLIGDVLETDESFTHELGTEAVTGLEIANFSVMVYIRGIDYDITKSLKAKELEFFKETLLEEVNNGTI